MLKSSYKTDASVIISIPPLVGGVADVVVEIKGTDGWDETDLVWLATGPDQVRLAIGPDQVRLATGPDLVKLETGPDLVRLETGPDLNTYRSSGIVGTDLN
nr:hypothetical protein [Tanacetum cinerariifolium]